MRNKNNLTNKKIAPILLDRIQQEAERITYGKIVITFVPGTITLEVTKCERFSPEVYTDRDIK